MKPHQERARAEKVNYWQPHLRSWRSSGLSMSEYCKRHELNEAQFRYWQHQLLSMTHGALHRAIPPLKFTEIKPVASEECELSGFSGIELHCKGYCLTLTVNFNEGVMRRLLHLLDGLP